MGSSPDGRLGMMTGTSFVEKAAARVGFGMVRSVIGSGSNETMYCAPAAGWKLKLCVQYGAGAAW